jgi:hypothetical protein
MNRVVVCCALLAAVILAFAKDSIPDVVLTAKTVAVIARVGVAANAKTAPNAARAKKQLQQALTKWGRYQVVADLAKADLALVVTEGNSSAFEQEGPKNRAGIFTTSNMNVLSDSLAVYKGGGVDETSKPLWSRTESGEDTGWPAERLISRFRKEVEKASRK